MTLLGTSTASTSQHPRQGLTKVDSADVPCDAETSSAFCVASAAQSGDTSCDRCATVIVEEAAHGGVRGSSNMLQPTRTWLLSKKT